MHKNRNTRTQIANLSVTGTQLTDSLLAALSGGKGKLICTGDTPYETSTATLNSEGRSDTQTDCTSKAP